MDRIEAHVALSGDLNQVVVRSDMTWPEVILMKAIHGDAAVTNVEVVGEHELEAFDEPARLKAKYGRRYFEIWSRYESSLPLRAPDFVPRWDDEIVVEHRKRRPGGVREPAGEPVGQGTQAGPEQGGQQDQYNQPQQSALPKPKAQMTPGHAAQLAAARAKAQANPKPKVPPFKPTPIIKAPNPAPASEA